MHRSLSGHDEFMPLFPRHEKRHSNPFLEYADFMPDWSEARDEMLGYQLFESQSAGRPISPVFPTKEKLIDWLIEHRIGLVANVEATKEEWLKVIENSPDIRRPSCEFIRGV